MATVSSHILDSVKGSSAAGIRVELFSLKGDSNRKKIFDIDADGEGRINQTVDIPDATGDCEYELVFHSADFFASQSLPAEENPVMKTVVIRFSMSDNEHRYHLPMMLSPHSYSVWSSN